MEFLKKASKEARESKDKQSDRYLRGFDAGAAITYELCAEWIEEIIEKYPA